jgi:hypothetical protein
VLVLFRQVDHDGPWLRDEQQMNPNKVVEDPARGRVLHRLRRLVGKRGPVVLECLANALLQSGIHQQTHGHHHEQRHDPLRLFERERGSEKAGVFEEAKAAFRIHLTFVACEAFLGWELGVVEVVRSEDETTLLLNEGLLSRYPRGQGPDNLVDHVVGLSALARSPSRAIASRGAAGERVQASSLQPLRNGRERLSRIGFTGKGLGTQFLEGFHLLRTLLEEVLSDSALGLRLAGLCVDEDPAWRNPAVG